MSGVERGSGLLMLLIGILLVSQERERDGEMGGRC